MATRNLLLYINNKIHVNNTVNATQHITSILKNRLPDFQCLLTRDSFANVSLQNEISL